MRVLCAVGSRGGPEMIRKLRAIMGAQHELLLLHVIDTGPRQSLDAFLRGPGSHHRPPPPLERERRVDEVEEFVAKTTLEEARQEAEQAGYTIHAEIQRGQAEKLIVQLAEDGGYQLIVIWSSEGAQGHPQIGPASIGRVARYVLDHAPCDVLMLREL